MSDYRNRMIFLFFGLFLMVTRVSAEEINQLSTIEVQVVSETQNLQPGVEVVPSVSTLETAPSEIQLNIIELKGVAGTQGDPLGAVRTLPGITLANGGGGRTPGFYVRGSNANENKILIDGLPVGYIYHFGGIYSVLNPDLIDNFKTYLGGFGVEYGDRLGGVVDVQTRKPNAQRVSQSYQVGFYDSSARIEGPTSENGSAFFAVRRSYIDLFLPSTGSLGSDSDNRYTQFPQFWDMQAKYRHELKDGFVDLSLFAADDQLRFDIRDEKERLQDPALLGDLGSQRAFQTLGLRWAKTLTPDIEQLIRLGVSMTSNDFVIGTQQAGDLNPGQSYGFEQQGRTTFVLPQWAVFQGDNRWKTGVDLYRYDFDISGYIGQPCREGQADCTLTNSSPNLIDEQFSGYEAAAYVELSRPITERLFATFGVRSSHYDWARDTYHEISPRVSFEYDWADATILTASWGRFVQPPQGNEISKDIGNPELVMTQAEHRILGVKHEWTPLWSTQVELYQKPMTKLVVSRSSPENYANRGEGVAQGLDVLIKRNFKDRRYGWLSYSYLESKRSDKDDPSADRLFDGDQPHTLNLVWAQPFGGSWSNWVWGASVQLQSGRPYTPIIGREELRVTDNQACQSVDNCYWKPTYGETNSKRLPVNARLDLSMERNIKFDGWNMDLRFELLNVGAVIAPDSAVVGLDYEADYSNFNNPDKVQGFPFLPSFSIRGNF
ncbi:TonB-dependent receptor plug domain-containing protein [Thiomicrospira microaerophila]|uniref:TonB-dependent receptor plug domain-containing protein n=1 Tax=Thiomicrospira microaerophila TaxID=406020 RepID=UPI002010149D|nr:TonB-dependent receptor [Thiomicrospira microaerophila]UQB41962.1 TonB-dependent receptor plug domain-containing protein [Thiomicrospira microaerophila]